MTIESLAADQRLYSVHSAGMSSNLISRKESLKSAAEIQGKKPISLVGKLASPAHRPGAEEASGQPGVQITFV